jgi:hypothetical protein
MRSLLLLSLSLAIASVPAWAQSTATNETPQEKVSPEPTKLESQDNPAFEMLQQAYYLGGQLPTDERAYQVSRVVVGASKMRHPLLRQWAHEVLQLTAGLPQRGMRQPTEQLALKSLAEVDPAEALQLLTQLTPATVAGLQTRGWDVRTNAAKDIFPKYWKGVQHPDLEAVRSAAIYLAETGQYPSGALALIIKDVGTKDTAAAEMLFLDAVGYHQRDQFTDFQVHAQFLELLKAAKGVVRDSVEQNGIEVAVNRLLKQAEEPPPKDMVYLGRVASGDGFVELNSVAEEYLFKILPLVRAFSPDLEGSILEQRQNLKVIVPSDIGALPEGYQEAGMLSLRNADGSAGDFEKDPQKKAQLFAQIINMNRVGGARRFAESDPEAARKLANSITDPALRAATLAELAGNLQESDPSEPSNLVRDAKGAVIQVDPKDQQAQLALLVSMARAQAGRSDAGLWDTLNRGLELAEELFEKEIRAGQRTVVYSIGPDGEGPLYRVTGFQEANSLVRIGLENQTANTLAWVAQEHDAALKSYLLVTAAEGLWAKQKAAGASTGEQSPAEPKATISIR